MDNLFRRPSGIYVARITIPIRLRPIIGRGEFVASTGTRNRTMAKLVACELLARWRRQLWEIERLQLPTALMNYASIIKLVDGSPVLQSGSYLPIEQAANVLGLEVNVNEMLGIASWMCPSSTGPNSNAYDAKHFWSSYTRVWGGGRECSLATGVCLYLFRFANSPKS